MSAFPEYQRYKDSGVEWLGEVPEHWEVGRVFSVFNERVETGHAGLPNLNITIGRGVQVEGFEGARKKRLIEDLDAYKRAAKGDIAYNTMRMWQGAVGDVPVDGLVSPAYVVARPIKPVNTRYYSHLFRTELFQTETNRHSYGIVSDRNRLYWLGFKNIAVPIPSLAEQDRIVDFLDRKTAEIDTLIAKKQRQIELLAEQKAILIHRTVTRGLDPAAKVKPSGIEWIGDIPEHWEVLKLRRLLRGIEQGNSPNSVQENGEPNQWKVITLSSVSKGEFRKDAFKPISSATPQKRANKLCRGDLLLTRANTRSLVGDACIVDDVLPNTTFSDLVYRLSAATKVAPKFLLRFLLSNASRSQIERDARGSNETMCKVSHGHIKEWDVALPPLREQLAIILNLEALEVDVRLASTSINSQIQSLYSFRTTLIALAVTGRIKV